MIVMMNVIAERKEEYEKVHKLLDIVLAVAGFWILCETIKIGIHEYKELDAFNTNYTVGIYTWALFEIWIVVCQDVI